VVSRWTRQINVYCVGFFYVKFATPTDTAYSDMLPDRHKAGQHAILTKSVPRGKAKVMWT